MSVFRGSLALGRLPVPSRKETPRDADRCLYNAPSVHGGINTTSITMAPRCLDNPLLPEDGNSVKQIICVSL